MDVEGRSAWTPVPMVLIAQRCVDTSRGPKEPTGAPKACHDSGGVCEAFACVSTGEGEYVVLSTGEGCGDACVSTGVWGRNVSTGVWGQNASIGVWGNARLRRAVSPLNTQRATPLAHHTREAYYRFPHTHRRWTANT